MSILASSLALGPPTTAGATHALCRDTDPELFFPVGTTGTALDADRAGQAGVRRVRRAVGLPRLRPRHQPGLRHLGRAVRGGAPGDPPPARRRRPPPSRLSRSRSSSAPLRRASGAAVAPCGGEQLARRRPAGTATRTPRRHRSTLRPGRARPGQRYDHLDERALLIDAVVLEPDGFEVHRLGGRIEIVPLSSVVTSVRTIDRPSPVAVSRSKPGSSPTPSSMTSTAQLARRRCRSETTTLPPPLPSGKPWSTAFCSSSVSTTDSGVATRAGMRPPSPASVKLRPGGPATAGSPRPGAAAAARSR